MDSYLTVSDNVKKGGERTVGLRRYSWGRSKKVPHDYFSYVHVEGTIDHSDFRREDIEE